MVDYNNTEGLNLQSDFVQIPDGDSLTCILPPDGGDYWPFGGNPSANNTDTTPGNGDPSTPNNSGNDGGKDELSGGIKAGIAVGAVLGVVLIAVAAYFIRKAALKRQLQTEGNRQLSSEDDDRWEGK